jgi:hypothetical protein
MSKPFQSDFAIVGSGIAGLSLALKAAEHGTVHLVTKRAIQDSATDYAQGGLAAVAVMCVSLCGGGSLPPRHVPIIRHVLILASANQQRGRAHEKGTPYSILARGRLIWPPRIRLATGVIWWHAGGSA